MSEGDDQRTGDVMSSLPSRRPQRRSARRDGGGAKRASPATGRAPTKPKATRAKAAGGGRRPKAVRPSAATRASRTAPSSARPADSPEGVELVGTAIQAAGELAQLGLTLGTKALRGALSRLPRP
jgi:hypothetical protein